MQYELKYHIMMSHYAKASLSGIALLSLKIINPQVTLSFPATLWFAVAPTAYLTS